MGNIDEMVRDFTQATPRSKSEVRSRILELLDAHTQEILEYASTKMYDIDLLKKEKILARIGHKFRQLK